MMQYTEDEFDNVLKRALEEDEAERLDELPDESELRYAGDLHKVRRVEKSVARHHNAVRCLRWLAVAVTFVLLCTGVAFVFKKKKRQG